MRFIEQNHVWRVASWSGIAHGFPTIHAQVDDVMLYRAKQVHGSDVIAVDENTDREQLRHTFADAVVTARRGMMIAVATADCVPILCYDHRNGVVSAIHAGWRGIVAGVIENTIKTMRQRFHSAPDDIEAAIGPCIRRCCFEVGEEVAGHFEKDNAVFPSPRAIAGKVHVDLEIATRNVLTRCGVQTIATLGHCTRCDARQYHSYRRDGAKAGRIISTIGLPLGDRL